jgi:hypothetical protein
MISWWSKFLQFITSPKCKGIVSVICAVIMYYTPDNIDNIIMSFLTFYGATHLMIKDVYQK